MRLTIIATPHQCKLKNLTFFLTRWEMSETAAVEVLPLEVDVLLICLEVKYHTFYNPVGLKFVSQSVPWKLVTDLWSGRRVSVLYSGTITGRGSGASILKQIAHAAQREAKCQNDGGYAVIISRKPAVHRTLQREVWLMMDRVAKYFSPSGLLVKTCSNRTQIETLNFTCHWSTSMEHVFYESHLTTKTKTIQASCLVDSTTLTSVLWWPSSS